MPGVVSQELLEARARYSHSEWQCDERVGEGQHELSTAPVEWLCVEGDDDAETN